MSNRNKNMRIIRAKLQKEVHKRRRPHRQRDKRMARALARLQQLRRPVTAFEIGTAAVEGERRAKRITRAGDRTIAVALARRGLLAVMPNNQFLLIHSWRTSHRDCNHPRTKEYSKCGLI
jgi:hypothetical protein